MTSLMVVGVHSLALAVLFAFASALLIAVGTVWRHRILRDGLGHGETNRSPLASLSKPTWWFSLSLAFAAYGVQALALAFGSLLVVQPVLVLSLMLTLVLAARVERRRMEMDETFWALVLTVCVGVVVILGRPLPGVRLAPTGEWLAYIAVGTLACAGLFAFAYRRSTAPALRALFYGIVCGAVFGYLAVFSKTTVDAFARGGLGAMLHAWQFWALLASSIIGTVVQQYAFGAGVLSRSLPAMKIVEPLVALSLGYVALGEDFSVTGPLGWGVIVAAILGMMVATGMLSRKPVT